VTSTSTTFTVFVSRWISNSDWSFWFWSVITLFFSFWIRAVYSAPLVAAQPAKLELRESSKS
jgi:hypothetical protein